MFTLNDANSSTGDISLNVKRTKNYSNFLVLAVMHMITNDYSNHEVDRSTQNFLVETQPMRALYLEST